VRRSVPLLIVERRAPVTRSFEIKRGYNKFRRGKELEICEGKISEGQIAAEALDAHERFGPAELGKV
jgi:hypothetical protein